MTPKEALSLLSGGAKGILEWNERRTKSESIPSLKGIMLKGADLARADLRKVCLAKADLFGADLRGAILVGANMRKANLAETRLIMSDLTNADLRNADLRGASLGLGKLAHVRLSGAKISGILVDSPEVYTELFKRTKWIPNDGFYPGSISSRLMKALEQTVEWIERAIAIHRSDPLDLLFVEQATHFAKVCIPMMELRAHESNARLEALDTARSRGLEEVKEHDALARAKEWNCATRMLSLHVRHMAFMLHVASREYLAIEMDTATVAGQIDAIVDAATDLRDRARCQLMKLYDSSKEPAAALADGPSLSLYFDVGELGDEEIADILEALSETYAVVGGDRLIINNMTMLDPSFAPVGV